MEARIAAAKAQLASQAPALPKGIGPAGDGGDDHGG